VEGSQKQYQDLLLDYLAGKLSLEDFELLRQKLDENEEVRRDFDENRDVWQASQLASQNYQSENAWNKLFKRLIPSGKTIQLSTNWFLSLSKHWKIAAILLLAFLVGQVVLYKFSPVKTSKVEEMITEYNVPYGSKSKVTLPDGSVVWLNSGSKLKLSNKFNISGRNVTLTGEAYFDIAKNPAQQFTVKTNFVTIKVIGTAFNVKAYPDESAITTTVERGIVRLVNEKGNQSEITLTAKQRAICRQVQANIDSAQGLAKNNLAQQAPIEKAEAIKATYVCLDVKTELFTSWKENRWVIEQMKLSELAVEISRRYDVKIAFADDFAKNYVFSGTLMNESLEQVLNAIKYSAPISFEVNKKNVKFYSTHKPK
jgi:transmembrane sensor